MKNEFSRKALQIIEKNYREYLRKILAPNPDCVNYLDQHFEIHKIEQKLVNAGMAVIISVDIVHIRFGQELLNKFTQAKKEIVEKEFKNE